MSRITTTELEESQSAPPYIQFNGLRLVFKAISSLSCQIYIAAI